MKEYKSYIIGVVVCLIIVGVVVICSRSASCQRSCVDIKSDYTGGLDRTIVVYTANGDIIAEYHGKIDIDANDGGYIKFDFEGKRYIYYNCFVESIANIK